MVVPEEQGQGNGAGGGGRCWKCWAGDGAAGGNTAAGGIGKSQTYAPYKGGTGGASQNCLMVMGIQAPPRWWRWWWKI